MADSRPDQHGDSVFTRPARGRRAQPALSRDRIVAATIALLDREGAAALTMRKLAAELGVHATSLYWYVQRREDLVDLAVDEILAEAAAVLPGPEVPWRTAVKETAGRFYAALTAHAWAAEFAGTRPLIGPNAVALARRIITALHDCGGSEETQAVAIRAFSNQILGAAATAVAMRQMRRDETDRHEEALAAAVSDADALATANEYFDQVLDLLIAGIDAQPRN
ncbi:TetR/AcrR family transcriptional regulator C-terminal domain-containing protein [Actinomadura sp. NAK00032]|uniref:TetR/AcrR family transcriptional regulator C-terminal domain-containing protein n=1 Tax=Actinomadura sp. NAK00032 TaxID=2742128 RepID=UPI001592596D|nr:TetR/AcrR family transcriptional regulator C-terminal domain-containing protein [Actinomadura sp. NAK00032]QKW33480.1 TetR/AcrR family transcriptional regulator C-terminal domain-containing protein [Actinomadura sp. NAK00032]